MTNSRAQHAAPVNTTNSCPACDATAQRDVQIVDALQTIQRVLNGTDGLRSPWLKLARIKAASGR